MRVWLAAAALLLPACLAAQGPAHRRALPPPPAREAGAPRLVWPTSGALKAKFGAPVKGLPNNGIDLAAFAGMTVHAAAAGKVVFAGTEPERFGQLILIEHGGGWVTAYAYLGQVRVKEGQRVKARQVIARIGKSGEARRPGLHFELRKGTSPRDPARYLPVRL
jgi:lipoprotein NlpD